VFGKIKNIEERLDDCDVYLENALMTIRETLEEQRNMIKSINKELYILSEKVRMLEEQKIAEPTEEETRNYKMQNKDGMYNYQRYKDFVKGKRKEDEE
jgi:uncharacterized coiled-coil protein SlyX